MFIYYAQYRMLIVIFFSLNRLYCYICQHDICANNKHVVFASVALIYRHIICFECCKECLMFVELVGEINNFLTCVVI